MAAPTLRQLEYVVAVADERHFGRAAERALVSQPALSTQVRELERRLGVTIFDRGTPQIELTEAGEEIVRHAREVLRITRDLEAEAMRQAGAVTGRARVAAIPTLAPYVATRAVSHLQTTWPDALIEFQEAHTIPMVQAIADARIDIGLLALPVDTSGLTVHELIVDPFYLALPTDHPAAVDEPIALAGLCDVKMLLLPEGHCLRDHAQAACELAGRVDDTEIHCSTLATVVELVSAGVGATLLPASAVTIETRSRQIKLRRIEPEPSRTLAAVCRPTDPRHDAIAAATAGLTDHIAQLLADAPAP